MPDPLSAARKALRVFRARDLSKEDVRKVGLSLKNESDRSVAIVMAALVETHIDLALRHRLKHVNDAKYKLLLGTDTKDGIVPSFVAKARLANALSFIGDNTLNDIIAIADLRNSFAHMMNDIDFSTAEIGRVCMCMTTVSNDILGHAQETDRPPERRFRSKYVLVCSFLSMRLSQVMANDFREELILELLP